MRHHQREPVTGRGVTFMELVLGIVLLSIVILPLYQTFITSQKSMTSSRLAYMSMQVARELLDEIRATPIDRLQELDSSNPTPIPLVAGGRPLFATLALMRSATRAGSGFQPDPGGVGNTPKYPDEYNRIKARIKVENRPGPVGVRLKKVTLDVEWQESGGVSEKNRPGLLRFITLVGNHSVDPEVPQ